MERYYSGPIGVGGENSLIFRQERPEEFAENTKAQREWFVSLDYPLHVISTKDVFPVDTDYSYQQGIDGVLKQIWKETYPEEEFENTFQEYCHQYFAELTGAEREQAYWWYLCYIKIKDLNSEIIEKAIHETVASMDDPIAAKVLQRIIDKDSDDIREEYFQMKFEEFRQMTNAGQIAVMMNEMAHSNLLGASKGYFCAPWHFVMAQIQKELEKEWLIIPFVVLNDDICWEEFRYHSAPQSVAFVRKCDMAKETFGDDTWDDKKHFQNAIRLIESDIDEYVKRINSEYWYVDLYRGGKYSKDESFDIVGSLSDALSGCTTYLPDDFRRLFYAQKYTIVEI